MRVSRHSTSTYDLVSEISFSESTKEVKLECIFAQAPELYSGQEYKIITTDKNDLPRSFDVDCKFQLRIRFRKYSVELYYLAPRKVHMKCNMCIIIGCNPPESHSIAHDFMCIEQNMWIHLGDKSLQSNLICGLKFAFQFTITTTNISHHSKPQKRLSKDLLYLLDNCLFTDITIKSDDATEIQAHKGILSSRSPVFRAHFEHDMVENRTNIIEFPMSTEVLQEVLRYIYTEEAPDLDKMPDDLLVAADFFQLTNLKDLCGAALSKLLTVENVMKTLELANLYSLEELKLSCFKFINIGDGQAITKTKGWEDMKSMELIKNIAEYIMNHPYNK